MWFIKLILWLVFLGWGTVLFIPCIAILSALVGSGWLGFVLTVLVYIGIGWLLAKL